MVQQIYIERGVVMYTTNNDVRTATITIKIRPTGEYGNRRKVTITLPAEFDINDKASTEVYYHAWNEHRGLPADHPYRTAIESVKDKAIWGIRLHELMLTSCKGVTSVSFIGETHDRTKTIERKLSQIFGNNVEYDSFPAL